jgi:transposase
MPRGGRRDNWNIAPGKAAQAAIHTARLEDFVFMVKDKQSRTEISQRMGVTKRTVERWFAEARRRGLLPE